MKYQIIAQVVPIDSSGAEIDEETHPRYTACLDEFQDEEDANDRLASLTDVYVGRDW